MVWWPFSKKTRALTPEEADRCRRRCGMAAATLSHCLAANPLDSSICSSLETQVVHCHTEVIAPELAAAHQRCFQRVVNSKGRESYSACSKEIEAMKTSLRQVGLYPFSSSSSGRGSGGVGSSSGAADVGTSRAGMGRRVA